MDEAMKHSVKLIAGLAMLGAVLTTPVKAADDAIIDEGTIAALGDPATAVGREKPTGRG
jgi:ABC-type uncharacterized transport system substrate-binding protein